MRKYTLFHRLFPLSLIFIICVTALYADSNEKLHEKYKHLLNGPFRIENVYYRPASWETENVKEKVNERVNQGGLVFVYYKNNSDKQVRLRSWHLNGDGASEYRISYKTAWDRMINEHIEPGQTGVLEICGISNDFAPAKPFKLALINRDYEPVAAADTTLKPNAVEITCIHIPSLDQVQVFLRNNSQQDLDIKTVNVCGKKRLHVTYMSKQLPAGGLTIAKVKLKNPLKPGEPVIIKTVFEQKDQPDVFAHRFAYQDYFPIGTWGVDKGRYQVAKDHAIDTIVQGGRSKDQFYSKYAKQYGFRSMVHVGTFPETGRIKDLQNHPAVAAWMITDEPDWHVPAQYIFSAQQVIRRHDSQKPTMLTLCRNVRFFEYAFIADIPAHDHYSVTAPSTSVWPHPYGTRLEETAYYTRDLKNASQPKPIWVWSQGMFNWSQRPKRPVPTPDELGAQLLFNIGRGAKGILWFTFRESVGEKYPLLQQSIKDWGRVMKTYRSSLAASEPVETTIKGLPEKLDTAVLLAEKKMFILLVNLDYEINDQAYRWQPMENIKFEVTIPAWIAPKEINAYTPLQAEIKTYTSPAKVGIEIDKLDMGMFIAIENNE